MTTRKEPLRKDDFTGSQGVPHWLYGGKLFRPETALHVTKCRSVARQIIFQIAKHTNNHARKTIRSEKHISLLVDGCGSSACLEWIEACERINIIVVQPPANTMHILQPCDEFVNRSFHRTVRRTQDHLLHMIRISWTSTSYNMKLAVSGYQSITPDDARASFVKCGL